MSQVRRAKPPGARAPEARRTGPRAAPSLRLPRRFASGLLALGLASCSSPLLHEPWSQVGPGTNAFGLSSGWSLYRAEVEATGRSGALAPGGVPEEGSDTSDLQPVFGAAGKWQHFVTDRFALGTILEVRRFDPEAASPLSATLEPDAFTTVHLLATSRYYFAPLASNARWRPFVGLDLGFVPEVDLEGVRVRYPSSSGLPDETVDVSGDAYWTIAPVVGVSYLLSDRMSLELGGFYEWSLDPSEGRLRLANLGGAEADVEVWPEGLIVFAGLTWYF